MRTKREHADCEVKPLHLGDHVGAGPIAQSGLATYAAARAEARISNSFLVASFVQCFAFRSRNFRSFSSLVRAAYHSHCLACSKRVRLHLMLDDGFEPRTWTKRSHRWNAGNPAIARG